MKTYDPDQPLTANEWLALPEPERLDIVEAFHRTVGGYGENLRLHATIHAVVENQLAMGEPAIVRQTLSRLTANGVGRHNSIHAIGSVLAEQLFPTLQGGDGFDHGRYARELGRINPKQWRHGR